MSTTYTFNDVAAQQTSDYMQTTSRNLQNLVDEMNSTLVSNLADWNDAAKDQYHAAQTEWNQSATFMWNALVQAQQVLNGVSDGYTSATRVGVKMFS